MTPYEGIHILVIQKSICGPYSLDSELDSEKISIITKERIGNSAVLPDSIELEYHPHEISYIDDSLKLFPGISGCIESPDKGSHACSEHHIRNNAASVQLFKDRHMRDSFGSTSGKNKCKHRLVSS